MSRNLIEVTAYELAVSDIINTEEFIPEFYIVNDKIYESSFGFGVIPQTDDHRQDKIVMFDISAISSVAVHEFCECGTLDFILGLEPGLVDIIKNHCPKWVPSDFTQSNKETFVVIDIDYIKSYDHWSGAYEYDTEIGVVGYLDSNMELVLWK